MTATGIRAGMVAAAILAGAGAAGAEECPAGGAVYRQEGTDRFTLTLERLEHASAWSDVGAVIADRTTGDRWSFGLTASNGYSMDYLVPEFGPEERDALEVFFFASEEGYAGPVRMPLPMSEGPAPDLVFIPRIGTTFWYDMPERIDMPTEMWVRVGCVGG
jgi:hypothetical protein